MIDGKGKAAMGVRSGVAKASLERGVRAILCCRRSEPHRTLLREGLTPRRARRAHRQFGGSPRGRAAVVLRKR
jgi:hypothetical protein